MSGRVQGIFNSSSHSLSFGFYLKALLFLPLFLSSCQQINDERIPGMAVNLDLSNPGVWISYGVHSFGQYNYFINSPSVREPAGFAYSYNSATGYGGILLIGGLLFSGEIGPLAYDLSCPVERLQSVRVYIDRDTFDAVCPECESHYNVVQGYGAPISGPAQKMHYGLTQYSCYPTTTGGYIVTR